VAEPVPDRPRDDRPAATHALRHDEIRQGCARASGPGKHRSRASPSSWRRSGSTTSSSRPTPMWEKRHDPHNPHSHPRRCRPRRDPALLPGVKTIWPKLAQQADKEGWPAAASSPRWPSTRPPTVRAVASSGTWPRPGCRRARPRHSRPRQCADGARRRRRVAQDRRQPPAVRPARAAQRAICRRRSDHVAGHATPQHRSGFESSPVPSPRADSVAHLRCTPLKVRCEPVDRGMD
jgi:hypothetical protein